MPKETITIDCSRSLRAVAFFCSLLVVPIHCVSFNPWFAGTMAVSKWDAALMFLFSDTVSRCAVPCFFALSGFFLAQKYEPTFGWYVMTLRKRFRSLYLPFVIWNVLYLCRNSLIAHVNLFSLERILGYNLFAAPGYGLFWYVQTILLAVLFAPIWLPLCRCFRVAVVIVMALVAGWLTGNFGCWWSLQLNTGNFLWLAVGAYVAFNIDRLSKPSKSIRMVFATLLLVFIIAHVFCGVQKTRIGLEASDKCVIAFGVATIFMNADLILRLCARFETLFPLSFFIYAMHPQGILVHGIADRLGSPFMATYFLKMTFGIVVPIAVGLLMRRYAPWLLAVLTGNRAMVMKKGVS